MNPRLLALVLVLVAMPFFAACGDDPPEVDPTDNNAVDEESVAILDNLGDYEDEEVTVTAVVDEPVGDRGVLVYSHATSDDKVLVVSDDGHDLTGGAIVEISGTVKEFDADEAEGELDVDPADPAYEPYFGDLVVVADSISAVET